MIKNLLRLLARSASFVALLLIANTAMTTPSNNLAQAELSSFSLNVISPSLQLVSSDRYSKLEHLGCSCAVCTQSLNHISSDI